MDKKKLRLFGYVLIAVFVTASGLMFFRGHSRDAGLPNPVADGASDGGLPSVDGPDAQHHPGGDSSAVAATSARTAAPAASATMASAPASQPSGSGPDALALAAVEQAVEHAVVTAPESPTKGEAGEKFNDRVQRLERNVRELIAGLRSQGYLKPAVGSSSGSASDPGSEPDVVSTDFNPYSAPALGRASVASRPSTPAPRPIRVAAKPATAASQPTAAQGELLSVDLWDGRPSAVVGTGIPGDTRVRVLSVGDVHNGVTLKAVDVAAQRATFSVAGRDVQLGVEPSNTVR